MTTTQTATDIISSDQIDWQGRTGSVVASDIGLHAGYWPQNLRVNSTRTGGWARFERHAQETREGDLILVRYIAVCDGLFVTLTVFND